MFYILLFLPSRVLGWSNPYSFVLDKYTSQKKQILHMDPDVPFCIRRDKEDASLIDKPVYLAEDQILVYWLPYVRKHGNSA